MTGSAKFELTNANEFKMSFANLRGDVLFAHQRALRSTAFELKDRYVNYLRRKLKRPVPFTLKGVRVFRRSYGTYDIVITPTRYKYLRPLIEGKTDRRGNILKGDGILIGGPGIKRNVFGNVPSLFRRLKRERAKVRADRGKTRGSRNIETPTGIYRLSGKGSGAKVTPLFFYVKSRTYKRDIIVFAEFFTRPRTGILFDQRLAQELAKKDPTL